MEKRTRCCLMAAISALALAGITVFAGAQDPPPQDDPGGFGGPPQMDPMQGPQQFGQRPGFAPMPGFMPQMPEMSKKMVQIMALREIVAMGFRAKDISAALPALKELRAAEKNLQERSDQILDEEKQSLLAADPEDPIPMNSSEKMRQVSERFRQQQERGWQALLRAIGPEKTSGIQRLLGQGMPQGMMMPGGGMPGMPGGFNGPGGRPRRPDDSSRPGGQPSPSLGDDVGQPFLAPVAAGGGGETGMNQSPEGPSAQGFTPLRLPIQPGQGQRPRAQGQFGPRPMQGQGMPGPPGMQGMQGMAPMGMPFMQPHVTLAELIELLEQKLAAMKK